MIPVAILLGALALCVVSIAGIYNKLVTLRNRYQNAFAQIDVQLKRRYDLIPNLVETAKAYLAHEKGTLEAVIAARSGAVSASRRAAANPGDAGAMAGLASAEGLLGASLGKLFALKESYPDLKADATMGQLSEELTSTENRVAFARQAFNDAVTSYNTQREVFPSNLVAGMFHFSPAALLEVGGAEIQQVPRVSFS
jgi:LemA protein